MIKKNKKIGHELQNDQLCWSRLFIFILHFICHVAKVNNPQMLLFEEKNEEQLIMEKFMRNIMIFRRAYIHITADAGCAMFKNY